MTTQALTTSRIGDERVPARLWARVQPEENGCWSWCGEVGRLGYGRAYDGRRMRLAHRLFYMLLVGEIPDATPQLDHVCHSSDPVCNGGPLCMHRRCVNPAHLEPVTQRINSHRSWRTIGGRKASQTSCANGHEYTPENTLLKDGHRKCRQCAINDAQRKRERRLAEGLTSNGTPWRRGPGPLTHCKYGHEMTPENTRMIRNERNCRECAKRHKREARARQRGETLVLLSAADAVTRPPLPPIDPFDAAVVLGNLFGVQLEALIAQRLVAMAMLLPDEVDETAEALLAVADSLELGGAE